MSKNRAAVTLPVELDANLADWLAGEAETRQVSPAELLAKLAGEFRQRIENEDAEDSAEADGAIDAIERSEETVRPWGEFKREAGGHEMGE